MVAVGPLYVVHSLGERHGCRDYRPLLHTDMRSNSFAVFPGKRVPSGSPGMPLTVPNAVSMGTAGTFDFVRMMKQGSGTDMEGGQGAAATIGEGDTETEVMDLTDDITACWRLYHSTLVGPAIDTIVELVVPDGIHFRLGGCKPSGWFNTSVRTDWSKAMKQMLVWESVAGLIPFRFEQRNGHRVPVVVPHGAYRFKLFRRSDGTEYVAAFQNNAGSAGSKSAKSTRRADIWVYVENHPVMGVLNSAAHRCLRDLASYETGRQLQLQRNAIGAFPPIFTSLNPSATTAERMQTAYLGPDSRSQSMLKAAQMRELAMTNIAAVSVDAHKAMLGAGGSASQVLGEMAVTPTVTVPQPVLGMHAMADHMVPLPANQVAARVGFNPSVQRDENKAFEQMVAVICMHTGVPVPVLRPDLSSLSSRATSNEKLARLKQGKKAIVMNVAQRLYRGIFSPEFRYQPVQEFGRNIELLNKMMLEWLSRLDMSEQMRRAELLAKMSMAARRGRNAELTDLQRAFSTEPQSTTIARDMFLRLLQTPHGQRALGVSVGRSLMCHIEDKMKTLPSLYSNAMHGAPGFSLEMADMVSKAVLDATRDSGPFLRRMQLRQNKDFLDRLSSLPSLMEGAGDGIPALMLSAVAGSSTVTGGKRKRRAKEEEEEADAKAPVQRDSKKARKAKKADNVDTSNGDEKLDTSIKEAEETEHVANRMAEMLRESVDPMKESPFRPDAFDATVDQTNKKLAPYIRKTVQDIASAVDRETKVKVLQKMARVYQSYLRKALERALNKFSQTFELYVHDNVQVVIPDTQPDMDLEELENSGVLHTTAFRVRASHQFGISQDDMPEQSPLEVRVHRRLKLYKKFVAEGHEPDVVAAALGLSKAGSGGSSTGSGDATAFESSKSRSSRKHMEAVRKAGVAERYDAHVSERGVDRSGKEIEVGADKRDRTGNDEDGEEEVKRTDSTSTRRSARGRMGGPAPSNAASAPSRAPAAAGNRHRQRRAPARRRSGISFAR